MLERTLKLFRQSSKVAKVGGWEVDLKKNKVAWTFVTKEIHEVLPDFVPDIQTGINFYKAGESRENIIRLINNAIEKGEAFDAELQIITAKGNERWVRTKGETEFFNGKCVRVYGVFQDIHKEKIVDIQLARSEQQFRNTFSHAPIGMAIVAPNGNWISVNKSLCDIVGYTESELLQISFQDITHPEDLERDLTELRDLLTGSIKSYQMEKRYFHKSGKVVWIILSVSLVRDEEGNPLHFVSQIMDITARKQAEQIIKEERKLLRTLVDNIPVKIQIKDLESKTILDNHKNEEYEPVNASPDDVVSKTDNAVSKGEMNEHEDAEVLKSGQSIINKETLEVTADGKEAWFLNSKIPLKDDHDKITGLLKIGYDISERKEYEKQLNELVEVTNEQNARLLNFAHIVSHNLGSHSTNFAMLLFFLETETNEATKKEMFNLLKKASTNLTDTVANLNEVVAVTTNTHKESRAINLKQAIQNVQDNINGQLLESSMEVHNEVNENFNIKGVPAYIDSVLLNFLTNGIKYRSPDRNPFVQLSAEREDKYIVLTVTDNGLGIDLEKYGNNLFGMNKTFHGNKDARGVGLFITKNQVEAMGGKIKVESKVGKGTTFKIYFIEN